MAKKKINDFDEYRDEVLVVKATPLSDGWETDADRIPLCIVSKEEAKKYFWIEGYEIHAIRRHDGNLLLIKEWEEE